MSDRDRSVWWLADKSRAAEAVSAHAESLLQAYGRQRRRAMAVCRAVYLNEAHPGYAEAHYYCPRPSKYPVTQGGVDSLASKLALSQPRPKVVPGSRRFKEKRRARRLQEWLDGLWRKNETPRLMDDQLHDAMVYRAGVIKVVAKHGTVAHERRRPWDILTDPREETLSSVRSLFEVCSVDREVLADSEFVEGSKMAQAILNASDAVPEEDESTPKDQGGVFLDQVKVIEAWRLPSCPDKPGRHIMACGRLLLVDDPWEWDCFPFSILAWGRDPERMMGQGLVQRGMGIQSMLNHHCETVDQSFRRFIGKVAVARGSNVDTKQIDDEVAQAVDYDAIPSAPGGGVPVPINWGPIAAEHLNYSELLAQRWHAITGVSQMDARSEADPSLESGKAKLVQADIYSTRFYLQGKGRERACVRLAELSIKMADALCDMHERHESERGEMEHDEPISLDSYRDQETGEGPEREAAESPDTERDEDEGEERDHPLDMPTSPRSWRTTMPYSEARMSGKGAERYSVEVFPVSSLSTSIQGRMEEIAQMEANGYIGDKQQARELLDMPILEEYQDLASARRLAAEREIDRCLDGEQGTPSTYWELDGLDYAIQRATNELALSGIDDAPADVLELLRSFIAAGKAMLTKMSAPPDAMPPAAAPGPPTMGGPAPMPPMPADPMAAA